MRGVPASDVSNPGRPDNEPAFATSARSPAVSSPADGARADPTAVDAAAVDSATVG